MTGYYRRFIKNYGEIARPLTQLLKKHSAEKFSWNQQTHSAFEQLKAAITTAPVLSMPNFQKTFVLKCDASGKGLGAVLMQDHKPIAFYIKALSEQNLIKSTYEKELMALVLAIRHWRPYLIGRKLQINTA